MASSTDEKVIVTDTLSDDIKKVILKNAKRYAPRHIAPHITSEETEVSKKVDGYAVKIRVLVKKYKGIAGIADARAQEYGSGTRSTRKFKSKGQSKIGSKYIIKPKKDNGVLVFDWEPATSKAKRQKKFDKELITDKKIAYEAAKKEIHSAHLKQLRGIKNPVLRAAYINAYNKKSESLFKDQKALIDKKFAEAKLETGDTTWYLKSVNHPGIEPYKGRGYLGYALEKSKPKVLELLKKQAGENVQKLATRIIFSRPGGKNK